MSNVLPIAIPHARVARRRVLHVGCGHQSAHRLHAAFRDSDWHEIRLDIDERVKPDIVCSTVDMTDVVGTGAVDAVWSSHTIEHLYDHEVTAAFAEFRRVLSAEGFLLLRCPDLEAVAESLLRNGLEHVAYESPAGPITPLDMLYGHRPSIAAGSSYMAHRTGFTDERMGRTLMEAGFSEARTKRATNFDLWAVAFAEDADVDGRLDQLARNGLRFDS
ncbi:class I SAM-dependent methyltransferase [Terrarubrum flagellatum]|uniref:class I SAM-dependent methyltransferase n=1 Tax=Terrirubrum flagellatum TaxID=2895980 RepID=UPI0031455B18